MVKLKYLPTGRRPVPDDVFRLAAVNPIAQAAVQMFRRGELTWEEAVTALALGLADANEGLRDILFEARLRRPPPSLPLDPSAVVKVEAERGTPS